MVNACVELLASPVATYSIKLPVSCTNVASIVCWNTTAVDYYAEDHEAYAGDNLNYTEYEFDLFN